MEGWRCTVSILIVALATVRTVSPAFVLPASRVRLNRRLHVVESTLAPPDRSYRLGDISLAPALDSLRRKLGYIDGRLNGITAESLEEADQMMQHVSLALGESPT